MIHPKMHIENMLQGKHDCDHRDLWSLPNEILVQIFKGSHIRDLLHLKLAHFHFCDLVENHAILWTQASFQDIWPSQKNLKYFQKAAHHGNVEALIKLGIAYLYNEGLTGDFEGKKITENGLQAASMFCRVEALTYRSAPFTWLFIRPPWSARGACCKEFVFDNMVKYAEQNSAACVHVCVAHTLELLEDDDVHSQEMTYHLTQARRLGSNAASYLLWCKTYNSKLPLDRATELQSLRELRLIANEQSLSATVELCRKYAEEKFGGMSREQAASFVREFIQHSKPTNVNKMYNFQELNHSMRYILMDWLVEVANMKEYSSVTLHVAIDIVDRVLKVHKITRAKLQLLGVSAMVLCSRFLGKDIITIREAAWLTDNTYKYEDVVRMMGEITATLRGNFRRMTSFDYVDLINVCAKNSAVCSLYAQYMCELALLQSDLGDYPQAQVAAASVLLARLSLQQEKPWPAQMELFTGYKVSDLKAVTALLHKKCFGGPPMKDHRHVDLEAVKHRYEDIDFMSVSGIPVISGDELCDFIGSAGSSHVTTYLNNSTHMNAAFISSPCRHSSKEEHDKSFELSIEREKSATPTMEKNLSEQFNNVLNKSFSVCSHSDVEDQQEELPLQAKETGGLDVEDLWCNDNCNFSSSCETSPVNRSSVCKSQTQTLSSEQNYAPGSKETMHIGGATELNENHKNGQDFKDTQKDKFTASLGTRSEPKGDSVPENNTDSGQARTETECSKISVHSTPHCGTSPIATIPLVSNASPIGGMSHFKVDAPASRYINSGVKIDFREGPVKNLNSFKALHSSVNVSSNSVLTNSSCINKSSSHVQEFQVFSIQPKRPISSTPTGKKTFSIFEERNCNNRTGHSSKNLKATSTITLRDLDSNTMVNRLKDAARERQPKKRRPSGSLGNDSKKQIL